MNFFSHKKVKVLNLIFKASEHKFKISEYFKKCGDLNNTIIICLTNKNKIIGGYTSLTFNSADKNGMKDPSR